jgi:capsular polysaccharide biosynthesis protein
MNNNQGNLQKYEKEVDLREIIMFFWRKKVVIICVTLIVTILAGIFSIFILKPVYNTSLNIIISIPETYTTKYGEYKLPITNYEQYINLIKSNDVIFNTINELGYDSNKITIDNLKERIRIDTVSPTPNAVQNSFQVTVSADNPEESLKIANQLYDNYIDFVDVMLKERAVGYYYNDFSVKIKTLENLKENTKEILAKNIELLSTIPQTINQKDAIAGINAGINGYVVLENIINPNYTNIENTIIENKETIINTESSIKEYSKYLEELTLEKAMIAEYYKQGQVETLESSLTDLVNVSIYQPSAPVAPSGKTSPSNTKNVVIGGVLGLMLGSMYVLISAYMKKEF